MDNTEGHATNATLAYDTAHQEPAGLGPASKCLAQMQNLRKVWHACQDTDCSCQTAMVIWLGSDENMHSRGILLAQVYGKHVAVHKMTLPLRVDEMTALLGHNGAGMLTVIHDVSTLLFISDIAGFARHHLWAS